MGRGGKGKGKGGSAPSHGGAGRGYKPGASAPDGNGHRGTAPVEWEKRNEERKGKGGGRGRGGHGSSVASQEPPSAPAAAAAATETDDMEGKSTKALVEALRAFSSPQWWLISKAEAAEEKSGDQVPRQKRMKREVFQQKCEERHTEMAKVYENAMMNDSEQRWLRKVCSEGTAGDRVASLTMLIQVCPVFATKYIKSLLVMAGKLGRSDAVMALDALKDLFIGNLLPDRKLRTLSSVEPPAKGLAKSAVTEICVVAWFEDYLKTAFAAFVQILAEGAQSNIVFFKTKAIKTASDMLAAKPEQERALLALLVNKFGDTAAKVSSNTSFHLKKLVSDHPGMKSVITKEIGVFLARKGISSKSKYFAVLFLSEVKLQRGRDKELASVLIHVFVSQLEEALKPQAVPKKGKMVQDRKGRWRKPKRKKINKPGLNEDDNRIIRTLINGIQRVIPYLDSTVAGTPVGTETIDILFKICHTVSAFSTRIAILSLLFKILIGNGDLPDRFYRLLYEQLLHFDLFQSAHRLQAFLLLRKCIPVDTSTNRGVAVMRRLLQVGCNAEAPVASIGLTILRELFVARRVEMKQLIQSTDAKLKSKTLEMGDDAEEERFVDDDAVVAIKEKEADTSSERYQPLAREPRHAKAQHTPLWELFALASHVHPFISHGATRLLSAETFEDVGENPFQQFSTGELLEQFAYASSKPRTKQGEQASARLPYNSNTFAKRKNVLPHERFFQMYFRDSTVQKQQRRKADARKQREEDFDEEGDGGGSGEDPGAEEQEDQFFDKYIEEQMPKGDFDCDADIDDGSDEMSDPDMDDDFDEDPEDDPLGAGKKDGGGDSGSDGSGEDEKAGSEFDEPSEGGSGDDAGADDAGGSDAGEGGSEDEAAGGTGRLPKAGKRKADGFMKERAKAIKKVKKKHEGSLFASADDFTSFLNEDFA